MAKGSPEAVLRPTEAGRALQIERRQPAEDLSPFVDYLWYVGWDVEEPHRQQVLPSRASTSRSSTAVSSCTASAGARSRGCSPAAATPWAPRSTPAGSAASSRPPSPRSRTG